MLDRDVFGGICWSTDWLGGFDDTRRRVSKYPYPLKRISLHRHFLPIFLFILRRVFRFLQYVMMEPVDVSPWWLTSRDQNFLMFFTLASLKYFKSSLENSPENKILRSLLITSLPNSAILTQWVFNGMGPVKNPSIKIH